MFARKKLKFYLGFYLFTVFQKPDDRSKKLKSFLQKNYHNFLNKNKGFQYFFTVILILHLDMKFELT